MNQTMNEYLLSKEAVSFLQELHRQFEPRRRQALEHRQSAAHTLDQILQRQDAPKPSGFSSDWKVASIPPALQNRQVEITGPAEPKMIINALNSGANVFMADFEDALSPTWKNILDGHAAIQEALRRTIEFTNENGRTYALIDKDQLATLIIRPRGWHLNETRFEVDGQPMSGSLFDFGLYLFHGGQYAIENGLGPFLYLPKLESSSEARLWADVFLWSETRLNLKPKSIRVTVLIETLPAALAMEDILFELRDSIVGLNAGRWDYLFSMIKSISGSGFELTFPDRARLSMDVPFMRRYCEKIVAVCERRGAQPMGGMSALIPSRKDLEKNERALQNVRKDKEREARQGFVGTWVAHPDLISVAREALLKTEKDLAGRSPEPTAIDLIPKSTEEPFTSSKPTFDGAVANIDIALRYIAHWVNGIGAVGIHGLMEDAATAEISRAQLWQWRKNEVVLDNGDAITSDWLRDQIRRVTNEIINTKNEESLSIAESHLKTAESLLLELVLSPTTTFVPFLTLPAMDRLKTDASGLEVPAKQNEGESNVHSRIRL